MDLEILHGVIDETQNENYDKNFTVTLVDSATNKKYDIAEVYVDAPGGNFYLTFEGEKNA